MNIELKERSRDDLLEIISAKNMKITMQKIEIEEIRKELINQDEYIGKLKEEYANKLQQKENIIKEVREKIEGVRIYGLRSGKTLIATLLNDILDILDKEVN